MKVVTDPKAISIALLKPNQFKSTVASLTKSRKDALIKYCNSHNEKLPEGSKLLYDILPPCELISRSYNNIFINQNTPSMGGYEFTVRTPLEYNVDFGQTIDFDVPYTGQAISSCTLLIKLSKLISAHEVKYISYPGQRILNSVKISIGSHKWKYNPELYNVKGYLRDMNNETWNKCMGQNNVQNFIINIKDEEHHLSGAACYGYQTFKKKHEELTLCIPIYLGIEDGNSIPLLKDDNISVQIDLSELENLICFKSNKDEKKMNDVQCRIDICEFYTQHKKMSEPNWILTIIKWPATPIKEYEIFVKTLSSSNDIYSFDVAEGLINNIYIGFRPVENLTKSQFWFSNSLIKYISQKIPIISNDKLLMCESDIPTENTMIDSLELKVGKYEYPDLNVSFLDTYIPYIKGVNMKFGPWYMFTGMQYANDDNLCESNRCVSINYTSQYISPANQVMMIVVVEKICMLNINGEEIFNTFDISDEGFFK